MLYLCMSDINLQILNGYSWTTEANAFPPPMENQIITLWKLFQGNETINDDKRWTNFYSGKYWHLAGRLGTR